MDLFDIVAARQGSSGGGTPQVQSDWEQDDSSKKDYIKNKPFEIETEYVDILEHSFTFTSSLSKGTIFPKEGISLEPYVEDSVTVEVPMLGIKVEEVTVNKVSMGEEDLLFLVILPEQDTDYWYNQIKGTFSLDFQYSTTKEPLLLYYTEDIGLINPSLKGRSMICAGIIDKENNFVSGERSAKLKIYKKEEFSIEEPYIPMFQSDWEESNPSNIAYIQNRTHYDDKDVYTKSFVFPKKKIDFVLDDSDEGIIGYSFLGYSLNLTPGKVYSIETSGKSDANPAEASCTMFECMAVNGKDAGFMEMGLTEEEAQKIVCLIMDDTPFIISGAKLKNINSPIITPANDTTYYNWQVSPIYEQMGVDFNYRLAISNYEEKTNILKQLDKKYIPQDSSDYTLSSKEAELIPVTITGELLEDFKDFYEGYEYYISDVDSGFHSLQLSKTQYGSAIEQWFTFPEGTYFNENNKVGLIIKDSQIYIRRLGGSYLSTLVSRLSNPDKTICDIAITGMSINTNEEATFPLLTLFFGDLEADVAEKYSIEYISPFNEPLKTNRSQFDCEGYHDSADQITLAVKYQANLTIHYGEKNIFIQGLLTALPIRKETNSTDKNLTVGPRLYPIMAHLVAKDNSVLTTETDTILINANGYDIEISTKWR